MEQEIEVIYCLSVTALFLVLYLFLRYKVNQTQRKRTKGIKKRKIGDAVETDSPVKNQERDLKERALEGVENRFSFISKALPIILFMLWAIFTAIPFIGKIPSVYISLLAAIFSVIAGFSLRPFLENLFSGVVISFFKSIRIGDTVKVDDQYGVVEDIGLTHAVVKRWDWLRIMIPNSRLINKEIENYTANDSFIWAHVEFFVEPDADLALVSDEAIQVAASSPYFNHSEEPSFWVMDLEKDSIKCWIAAWADTPGDAWELRSDIRFRLMNKLKELGVKLHKNHINLTEKPS